MDISSEALKQVAEIAERWNVSQLVFPVQGDAMQLDPDEFLEGEYDAVVQAELWEHVPDPDKVISEGLRVLKPGGYLIATTPIGTHHYDPFHIRNFDDDTIRELLKSWGGLVKKLDKVGEGSLEPSCYFIVLEKEKLS
ncbi:Ubiquinone biosynthesis O-methyltransferase [subsurface metagenome]